MSQTIFLSDNPIVIKVAEKPLGAEFYLKIYNSKNEQIAFEKYVSTGAEMYLDVSESLKAHLKKFDFKENLSSEYEILEVDKFVVEIDKKQAIYVLNGYFDGGNDCFGEFLKEKTSLLFSNSGTLISMKKSDVLPIYVLAEKEVKISSLYRNKIIQIENAEGKILALDLNKFDSESSVFEVEAGGKTPVKIIIEADDDKKSTKIRFRNKFGFFEQLSFSGDFEVSKSISERQAFLRFEPKKQNYIEEQERGKSETKIKIDTGFLPTEIMSKQVSALISSTEIEIKLPNSYCWLQAVCQTTDVFCFGSQDNFEPRSIEMEFKIK